MEGMIIFIIPDGLWLQSILNNQKFLFVFYVQ